MGNISARRCYTTILSWYFQDEARPATDEQLDRLATNGGVVLSVWG
jgi:hypothetical protein